MRQRHLIILGVVPLALITSWLALRGASRYVIGVHAVTEHVGESTEAYFGSWLSWIGDVDSDRVADYAVGAFGSDPHGMQDAGSVMVFSGKTNSMLYRIDGKAAGDQLGVSISPVGDVNGDLAADFIVGARLADPGGLHDAGRAYIFSGVDGSVIRVFDGSAPGDWFGRSVHTAGDVDADGVSDVIIGAYRSDPDGRTDAGRAYVYSGSDGGRLFVVDGNSAGDNFGISVSPAGDMNLDGHDDFAVGAMRADPGGVIEAGSAYVYSGSDGRELSHFVGSHSHEWFGYALAAPGDVDGDGVPDLVVGARASSPDSLFESGQTYVFSGQNGRLIHRHQGSKAGDNQGINVSRIGDVDGDGHQDLATGAYYADPASISNAGSVYIFSGESGEQLVVIDGDIEGGLFGDCVDGWPADSEGDLAMLLVGAPGVDIDGGIDVGAVYVFRLSRSAWLLATVRTLLPAWLKL